MNFPERGMLQIRPDFLRSVNFPVFRFFPPPVFPVLLTVIFPERGMLLIRILIFFFPLTFLILFFFFLFFLTKKKEEEVRKKTQPSVVGNLDRTLTPCRVYALIIFLKFRP